VMKTRKAIHSAMTMLLSKKPIEEITVTELSDAAEINRKTFYSYYNSVYMVAEEMEDEIVERFEDTLRKIDFETLLQDPQTTFNTLARIIASDLDFYETILTNRNQVYFLQKIITSLKERIMALYFDRNSKDFELQEYMLEYIISGLVSVYQKWFKSGRKTDMEELSKYISMLAVNGVKSILTAPDEEKESR
jgi:AcrR family transcriptional regulator